MNEKNKKGLFEKIKGSKFEGFLHKVGKNFPDILEVVGTAVTNPVGAVRLVGEKLNDRKHESDAAKKLHQEFVIQSMEWIEDLYKLEIQDRESAREREVKIVQATGKHDKMMQVVGGVVLLAFILVVINVLFFKIDPTKEKFLFHIVGVIEGAVISIVTFYYGSSRSSSEKQEILSRQLKK